MQRRAGLPRVAAAKPASHLCVMRDLARLIIQHYEQHAFAWDADRRRGAWNDKLWHDRFMTRLPRPARVLDLGCGSGWPVARHLAEGGLQVTGVDSSPTMISLCRRRLPGHDWILADMRALSLACRFEGILAWDSYFHLAHDDQRRMFDVFAAHAKPGTILMFNAGPRRGEAIGSYRGDPLYHASLDAAEYEQLLDQSGFEPLEHVRTDARAGGRTVWLARARGQLSVP
jgi:SAM-dependent methyltransferase